jgi:hypothetical protein
MNRLRHYVTYGNTRDFRPEDEEKKPSGEVTFVEPACSDAEIGKHRFRRRLFDFDKLIFFLNIYIESIKHDSANSHGRFRPRDISEVPPVTIRQTFMPSLRIHFRTSDRDVTSSRGLTLNRLRDLNLLNEYVIARGCVLLSIV